MIPEVRKKSADSVEKYGCIQWNNNRKCGCIEWENSRKCRCIKQNYNKYNRKQTKKIENTKESITILI